MHRYEARIRWRRDGAPFSDNRYSRGHQWLFDGGVTVPASSSPSVAPIPCSVAEAVDPDEALVASASSCHMLWFLSLAFTRITLRPRVELAESSSATPDVLAELHRDAHEECSIASSLKCDVRVETP